MDMATMIGCGASMCSVASFIPQAAKIIRSRETKEISAKIYALTIMGSRRSNSSVLYAIAGDR